MGYVGILASTECLHHMGNRKCLFPVSICLTHRTISYRLLDFAISSVVNIDQTLWEHKENDLWRSLNPSVYESRDISLLLLLK